jgi:thioredoxin reductase (NADPH)
MTVVVVGAGPAGVAAAVGCARGGATVVLLEAIAPGGEAMNADEVTELPGQPPISGPDFAAALTEQVLAHDIELRLGEEVVAVRPADGAWEIDAGAGRLDADLVVYCAGASPVALPDRPAPEADPLFGSGLFTCATCDGPMYAGRHVAVAGGGDTGVGGALTLSRYAERVVLYERELELTAQPALVKALATAGNVEVRLGAEVVAPLGGAELEGVSVAERDRTKTEPADGLMIAVGVRPRTGLLEGVVALDEAGGVEVGVDFASSAAGLFAAGDARAGSPYRCAAAFGDGLGAARGALARLMGRR